MNDDEIYQLFYPHTFRPRNRFAPVDYSYVHSELKKVGVTEILLWEEYCEKCNTEGVPHCCYATFAMNQSDWLSCNVHMLEFFGGAPVRIVCDNLKTGVIAYPKHGAMSGKNQTHMFSGSLVHRNFVTLNFVEVWGNEYIGYLNSANNKSE